jgi:phytoene synthase
MSDLAASYDYCRRMARRASSNFGLSFLLLPRSKRPAMHALYAFLRHIDDLADSDEPAAVRRERLAVCRAALDRALDGDAQGPILPALADTLARYQIPRRHLDAVLDGAEMDLDKCRYESVAELEEYCEHVASAVGLACLCIWGFTSDEALRPARACGLAMQWTNILRDVGEDLARGRVYLPQEDLRRCGYTQDELARGVADERFERLVRLEVDRASDYYRQAEPLDRYLNDEGRRVCGAMVETYRKLLARIAAEPRAILRRRVKLSAHQKLRIALAWWLRPLAPRAARAPVEAASP